MSPTWNPFWTQKSKDLWLFGVFLIIVLASNWYFQKEKNIVLWPDQLCTNLCTNPLKKIRNNSWHHIWNKNQTVFIFNMSWLPLLSNHKDWLQKYLNVVRKAWDCGKVTSQRVAASLKIWKLYKFFFYLKNYVYSFQISKRKSTRTTGRPYAQWNYNA
jgi:hypothetical protein